MQTSSQFFLGDLYPNFFPSSTRKQTIPEPSEQEHYEAGGGKVPEVVSATARNSVWVGLAVILALLFFLSS